MKLFCMCSRTSIYLLINNSFRAKCSRFNTTFKFKHAIMFINRNPNCWSTQEYYLPKPNQNIGRKNLGCCIYESAERGPLVFKHGEVAKEADRGKICWCARNTTIYVRCHHTSEEYNNI